MPATTRVRCRLPAYSHLEGTLAEFETADNGLPGAWVHWNLPPDVRAVTGCYFLLTDLILGEGTEKG